MISITGYQFGELIHDSSNSIVYRGQRRADNRPVILKILKDIYPTPEQITAFKREYDLIRELDIRGVIKAYALEKNQQRWVMVLEDFGGQSLSQLKLAGTLELSDFLDLAVKISGIVGQIHQNYIIHKDINPSNILVSGLALTGLSSTSSPEKTAAPINDAGTNSTARWEVKLTDFGISTKLSRETSTFSNPNVLEGTLAYISPEQTGRMNRPMDYRTDYYSLGATFYELLTGQRPFELDDPLALVHAHIAKPPIPPHELRPNLPPTLSDIILKLLSKDAEDRYQSAYGLKADLETCFEQWQENGYIAAFPLGQEDISDKLQIPQKLYGRQEQLEQLITILNRVSQSEAAAPPTTEAAEISTKRAEVVLITGQEGSGKSALGQSLYLPVTRQKGYFISGKFNQFTHETPYAPLIQAFTGLTQQLLMEGQAQIDSWRDKLKPALGNNGRIMTALIPELEKIIGPQPAVPPLEGNEAENRFNFVFQKFIQVFAKPDHPLAIFLDDIHWADDATLHLLERLLTASEPYTLLLVGAYRPKKVYPSDQLMETLNDLKQAHVPITEVQLSPLMVPDIAQLVMDAFKAETETATAFAEVILEKTEGSPYFIGEFLKTIHVEGLLQFQHRIGRWQWQLEQIRQQAVTDNVVQLMEDKMRRLPPETQDLVKLAACIGRQFDLETLAVTSKSPAEDVTGNLWAAVSEGLILLVNRNYQFDDEGNDIITAEYRFAHNRVQQAIYSLIPQQEKETLHWRVGQLMLRHTLPDQRTEKIFDLVNQLNLGRHISVTHSEWDELAELNLLAGQKAKATAAYHIALSYLNVGLDLLSLEQSALIRGATQRGSSWLRKYNLNLALSVEAAEAAYLSGDFEQMEQFVEQVIQHGKTLLDQEKVYEIRMRAYIAQNRLEDVVKTAMPVLRLLGVRFPRITNQASVKSAIKEIETALDGRPIETLTMLPLMHDDYQLAAMRILSVLSSATYSANPELLPFVVIKLVTLSLKHGNAPESALGYAAYGLLLCGSGDDIDTGYQFGNVALQLLERIDDHRLKARTLYETSTYIRHWKDHINDGLAALLEAHNSGLETGDLEYAARAVVGYGIHAYFGGSLLSGLERKMAAYSDTLEQLKQERWLQINELYRQTILILHKRTDEDRSPLSGLADLISGNGQAVTVEGSATGTSGNSLVFHAYLNRLILAYTFSAYDEAVERADFISSYLESVRSMVVVPVYYFYDSLARLAVVASQSNNYTDAGGPSFNRDSLLQQVTANQNQMRRWMQHAPMNYAHKYFLVEAEYARVLGRDGTAREFYDKAIRLTQENQYINDEALANELASQFYLDKGQSEIAQIYLQRAHHAYSYWGAKNKVKALEQAYPEMLTAPQRLQRGETPITTSVSRTQSIMGALDLSSVLKASQAISGEIMLDKLLAKMMKIIIENAGAQKGYLILQKKGEWVAEAEGIISAAEGKVLPATPVTTLIEDSVPFLPTSIINYVDHTRETVVLKDATKDNQFSQDAYITAKSPLSVLCAPLMHQAKLVGMVYLENNLTSDVFTPARLEILNLLSSQAAISIENARSYARQLELTKAYSRFVPRQILNFLHKESIIDVALGDQTQQEMTVLFSDIRSFTSLSEQMTPEESFRFINSYLKQVSPTIREHNGFIDKYIGDAIMALFPDEPEDAVRGAIAMQKAVAEYNLIRIEEGHTPIKIGAGLHTGNVMLGTIGEEERMEGTVISDTVNLASRLEGLTKMYGAAIIVSEQTLFSLNTPDDYQFRFLDKVRVKGKTEPVAVFEILDGNSEEEIEKKLATQTLFEQAIEQYNQQAFEQALTCFEQVLALNPTDKAAEVYLKRTSHFIKYGVPVDWEGVEALNQK